MKENLLNELEEYYDLEFEKVISQIKKSKVKLILLQFPDGLKRYATTIVDYLKEETGVEFLIYLGQCFGACDTPEEIDKLGVGLVIQFGHNELMPNY